MGGLFCFPHIPTPFYSPSRVILLVLRKKELQVQSHYSLAALNTFGLPAKAAQYIAIHSEEELLDFISAHQPKAANTLVLGGGSNLLLTADLDQLVLHNQIKGISTEALDDNQVLLTAGAGENWHSLVLHSLSLGLGGLENLSLIPGSTGAAPVQNIGAYGIEIKDVFHSCKAVYLETGEEQTFYKEDCQFGYRDSIFKSQLKGQVIITSVTFQLYKEGPVHTGYGAIGAQLLEVGIENPSFKDVSDAVIAIRRSKLPDPVVVGNAGSFFKNPVIPTVQYLALQQQHPSIPGYPDAEGQTKVPAGWLIEQAGWKGKTFGNYGVHKLQALVLVNYGGANGAEIKQLAFDIQADIQTKYGITLEPEVNILPRSA